MEGLQGKQMIDVDSIIATEVMGEPCPSEKPDFDNLAPFFYDGLIYSPLGSWIGTRSNESGWVPLDFSKDTNLAIVAMDDYFGEKKSVTLDRINEGWHVRGTFIHGFGRSPARAICDMLIHYVRADSMSEEEIIRNIELHQKMGLFHPYTCGADNCRMDLEGRMVDNRVHLVCPVCEWTQRWMPNGVYYVREKTESIIKTTEEKEEEVTPNAPIERWKRLIEKIWNESI